MTEGESVFYLREITSSWSATNVSAPKLAELAAANLIEMAETPVHSVRLTREGARQKAMFRQRQQATTGLSLTRKVSQRRPRRPMRSSGSFA